jgi:hypothetical protein
MAQATAKKSATGKSASDMASRKPVSGKGKAGGDAVQGAALASVFIKTAMDQAEGIEKMQSTLKDQLIELRLLSTMQHPEFRKGIREKQAAYAAEAVSTGAENITKYRAQNPRVNYVYALLSDWHTLSEALEVGWQPDLSTGWAALKGAAVGFIDDNNKKKAIAQNETAKTLAKQAEAVMKDTKLSVEKRQEEAAKIEGQIMELIKTTYKPRARVSARKPAAQQAPAATVKQAPISGEAGSNEVKVKQITTMLSEQPVPVILAVAAWVEQFLKSEDFKKREEAHRANEQAKKDQANKEGGTRIIAKAPKEGVPSESKEEKATANAGKRTPKRTRRTH